MERQSRKVNMRADVLLVKKNLVATRTLAQEMIKSNQVHVIMGGIRRLVTKPSEDFAEDIVFEVTSGFADEFVSRAGHKIKGAAQELGLKFQDKHCLDIGVSTGGFSDFLLRSGASSVLGIDVGHEQTHSFVRKNPRFTIIEKINARYLDKNSQFLNCIPIGGFDFVCMDVSFISVRLILPQLNKLLKSNGEILVLIKPQFELGPEALNEKGIVKDSSQYVKLRQVMIEVSEQQGFKVKNYLSSKVEGKDGNKEFFLYLSISQ